MKTIIVIDEVTEIPKDVWEGLLDGTTRRSLATDQVRH
jgi:hypothetical protein